MILLPLFPCLETYHKDKSLGDFLGVDPDLKYYRGWDITNPPIPETILWGRYLEC
jgi:hypothetical protein